MVRYFFKNSILMSCSILWYWEAIDTYYFRNGKWKCFSNFIFAPKQYITKEFGQLLMWWHLLVDSHRPQGFTITYKFLTHSATEINVMIKNLGRKWLLWHTLCTNPSRNVLPTKSQRERKAEIREETGRISFNFRKAYALIIKEFLECQEIRVSNSHMQRQTGWCL